ncbi:hypothetical protein [Acidovorax sp. 106]|uniref:hypothetical protein n=1 Tax=Acidovorax sp. 106 TaxID=2135637 RepID=UPI0011C3B720|nr:hypothetical protein [Acidovorax sp. 106]
MEPSFRRLETLRSSSCASFGTCITSHKTKLLAKTAMLLGYTALKLATLPENLIFAITPEFFGRSNNANSSKISINNKNKQILISVKSGR